MKRAIQLTIIAGTLCLAGCSDPKSARLPADLAQLETLKPQLEKLTPQERELFGKFVFRRAMKGTIFASLTADTTEAKTIGEAIDNQRAVEALAAKEEAEAAALKAKALAEREAALRSLRAAVTVALLSKSIEVARGSSGIELDRKVQISVAYKNNSGKDIAGVKGSLVIRDLFGDEVTRFLIANQDTMKAGGGTVWEGSRSLTWGFNGKGDEKFASLPEGKYKVSWEPEAIVFADGTKLAVPPN